MDLTKLSEPFPLEDIEWRPSRAGMGGKGIYCFVLAYITARAIQKRLDDVCGPENWRLEEPRLMTVGQKPVFACGISIHCRASEWVTKWDVCEATSQGNIDAAKSGWSGAMKRSGSQWAIGRYLYYLDETFAEVAEQQPQNSSRQWKWARLSEKHGGAAYWWKTPGLPAWALPKEPEDEVSEIDLTGVKRDWMAKFGEGQNPSELREGFTRFVHSVCGEFPVADHQCWTLEAHDKCLERLAKDNGADGIDSDVPFEE